MIEYFVRVDDTNIETFKWSNYNESESKLTLVFNSSINGQKKELIHLFNNAHSISIMDNRGTVEELYESCTFSVLDVKNRIVPSNTITFVIGITTH